MIETIERVHRQAARLADRPRRCWWSLFAWLLLFADSTPVSARPAEAADSAPLFRAGAAAVDVSPATFPVIVSGMFLERQATRLNDPVMSRAIVLDDGQTRLAVVIVDSLMLPRDLLDRSKQLAADATGISTDRMLIAATHTHSAPSAMGALGSRADDRYVDQLPAQIAESIRLAADRLQPARLGWVVVEDHEHNHCRRWLLRPDRIGSDPFGNRTVRANMHPQHESPDHIGPAGPADPDLTLLSIETRDGQPLAVLANYAMHYFGSPMISADFCGRFGAEFGALIDAGGGAGGVEFVGIMSQGTSGDSMWPDYSRPRREFRLDDYTREVARVALEAYQQIEYRNWVPLRMAESRLTLRRRIPDAARLKWANSVIRTMQQRLPRNLPEVYALEQMHLHAVPEVEIKLQAVAIGELGIATFPHEVYGLTGLKIKAHSPLAQTFNIELANGAQGYIPPPEQHLLGGYTTWPARTAGLEVDAEPKIVETLLALLEEVSGKARRPAADPEHDYARAVAASKPVAFWRLGEMAGRQATDSVGRQHGTYEAGVAFFLPGPDGPGLDEGSRGNRAAQFAGGCVQVPMPAPHDRYSVELWFWNGLPSSAREVAGYLFSRGSGMPDDAAGDQFGIGGLAANDKAGRLLVSAGDQGPKLWGTQSIPLRTWHHAVLTRNGSEVRVYLNGNPRPEISGQLPVAGGSDLASGFLAGRGSQAFNLEGRLDEVALYDRVLPPEEIRAHFDAAVGRPERGR